MSGSNWGRTKVIIRRALLSPPSTSSTTPTAKPARGLQASAPTVQAVPLEPMELPIVQVDAFASRPFGGNPAAVCLPPPAMLPLEDSMLQNIASEMNLSETAFLEPLSSSSSGSPAVPSTSAAKSLSTAGTAATTASAAPATSSWACDPVYCTASSFRVRWFTPAVEVPLCGHATMAAAAALFQSCGNQSQTLSFSTKSGELRVSRSAAAAAVAPSQRNGNTGCGNVGGSGEERVVGQQAPWFDMDLPLLPPHDPVPPVLGLHGSLVQAVAGGLPVQDVRWRASLGYLVLVLGHGTTREQLEALRPDCASMLAAARREDGLGGGRDGPGLEGVIVTCRGIGMDEQQQQQESSSAHHQQYDFLSRYFGPWVDNEEDPVTGSAHCVLGPYWAERCGKQRMLARQCSRRGGELRVEVGATDGENRMTVSGQAVVVLQGELLL